MRDYTIKSQETLVILRDRGINGENLSIYLNALIAKAFETHREVRRLIREFPEECRQYFRENDHLPTVVSKSPDSWNSLLKLIDEIELGKDLPCGGENVNARGLEAYSAIREIIDLITYCKDFDLPQAEFLLETKGESAERILACSQAIVKLKKESIDAWADLIVDCLMLGYAGDHENAPLMKTAKRDRFLVIFNAAYSQLTSGENKAFARHVAKHGRAMALSRLDPKTMRGISEITDIHIEKGVAKETEAERRDFKSLVSGQAHKARVSEAIKIYVLKSLRRWVK